jgi:hypothetical protein
MTATGGTTASPAGAGGSAAGSPALPSFDAGTEPGRNAIKAGGFCERLATIQCAGELSCCSNPGRDYAACKQEMLTGCTTGTMLDAIAAQSITAFDAAQARVVLDKLEGYAGKCDPEFVPYSDSYQGLRSIFNGTVAPGGSCKAANSLDQTSVAAALASCMNIQGYACLPALVGDWTCAPLAAVGGKCFTDVNCMPKIFCNNPNLDLAGATCVARKPMGASCEHSVECESLLCRLPMPTSTAKVCVAQTQQTVYCLKH